MKALIRRILLVAGLAATAPGAIADDTLVPGQSVADRPRPELDASGMPVGSFRLFPAMELAAQYDSNLFAADTNERGDLISLVSPSLELKSDWGRHSLQGSARADIADHRRNSQENYTDLRLDLNAHFDVSRASALRFSGGHHDTHEDRSSPDDVLGIEPTRVRYSTISASYARRIGRVSLGVDAGRVGIDYDDVAGALSVINNDDRDRNRRTVQLHVGFRLARDLDIVLRAEADTIDYNVGIDDNGLSRDSKGLHGGLGIEGAIGGATVVELFLGHAERNYDDINLVDIDTPWFGGRVLWNPTGLTTLTFEASRTIDETTFAPASGYRATRYAASVDHELLRNLLLNAGIFLQEDDYAGVEREDDRFGFTFGARYLTNRNLQLALEFHRQDRQSILDIAPSDDFTIDTITLTVKVQR